MQEIEVMEGGSALASGGTRELGDVTVGQSVTKTITVTNKGDSTLLVSGIDLDKEGEISRGDVPALPRALAPGESLTCVVKFTPAAADCSAKLIIDSDDLETPTFEVTLTGRGIKPAPPPRRVAAVGAKMAVDHAGRSFVARSDGTLWSRSAGESRYSQVPGLSDVQAIAASGKPNSPLSGVYAITSDGSLWLVKGGSREKMLDDVIDVSVGVNHVLALREDGRVFGSGYNYVGQRGGQVYQGMRNDWFDVGLTGVQRVAAGSDVSAALMRDGTVSCWGTTDSRQAGTSGAVRMGGLNGITAIASAGASNGYGLCAATTSSGEVFTWWGAGGEGMKAYIRVAGRPRAVAVDNTGAGGGPIVFVVTDDGTVWSCGANTQGQLGRGKPAARLDVGAVKGIPAIVDVVYGWCWAMTLDRSGGVWEWGTYAFPGDRATGSISPHQTM